MSEQSPPLRIAVLVKQVPDVNAITVDPDSGAPGFGSDLVMNTYDGYAVSAAVGIKERFGAIVTVVTAGPSPAREVLLRALATGADEAILIDLPESNALDTLAMSRILAAEIGKHAFDLVLAGQSTDDYESGQVGPQVAEQLDWPHVSLVTNVEVETGALRIARDAEASKEIVGVSLPAVLMVLSGRDSPQKFPTLRGMMSARKKAIPVVAPSLRQGAQRLAWSAPRAVEREAEGTIVHDMPAEEAAATLVAWLKERKLV